MADTLIYMKNSDVGEFKSYTAAVLLENGYVVLEHKKITGDTVSFVTSLKELKAIVKKAEKGNGKELKFKY